MGIRTDLADEAIKQIKKAEKIEIKSEKVNKQISVFESEIKTENQEKLSGKPKGKYFLIEFEDLEKTVDLEPLKEQIKKALETLLENKRENILVVGLGNREITCDNIGPLSVSKILATRHIEKNFAEKIGLKGINSVSILETGVLGKTGMEAAEITEAVVKKIKPSAVIVIDALASGSINRLYKSVQLCNAGIAPGSGVKNSRKELSFKTLSVPVVAIGVPTVVEASVIANELSKNRVENPTELVLTPKDCDSQSQKISELLSVSLNEFLQPNIDKEILLQLV